MRGLTALNSRKPKEGKNRRMVRRAASFACLPQFIVEVTESQRGVFSKVRPRVLKAVEGIQR